MKVLLMILLSVLSFNTVSANSVDSTSRVIELKMKLDSIKAIEDSIKIELAQELNTDKDVIDRVSEMPTALAITIVICITLIIIVGLYKILE